MTPLLSVLMITYNHEKFIGRSIESVLAQKTNFDFELIIGDDHSTDSTALVAKKYADQYPEKIKLLSHTSNMGVIPNFEHTLQRCKGKYIAMLEGDDRWIDELKLQRQVNFLEENPDYALCGGHTVSESSKSKFIYDLIKNFKFIRQRSFLLQKYDVDDVMISNHFKTLTVVFRAELMRKPLDPNFYKSTILDWLIYISLGMNSDMKAKYANLPHIMAAYNVHAGGIFSGTTTLRRLQIFADVRNAICCATNNKFFGYHYPILVLNDCAANPQHKEMYLQKLNDVYAAGISVSDYELDAISLREKIRKEIGTADIYTLGYLFSRTYLSAKNFDAFTSEIVQLMNLLNKRDIDLQYKEKLLRGMSAAWRACMFYEKFSVKTIFLFLRSLLSTYSDIYVYTLILTLYQNSKR